MKTLNDIQARLADERGAQALDNARRTLVRALNELDRFIDRYNDTDELRDKADALNWALNHLTVFVPSNVRLDMLASAQAELTCAATRAEMIALEAETETAQADAE